VWLQAPGASLSWHENGQKRHVGAIDADGLAHGVWTQYDATGKITEVHDCVHGACTPKNAPKSQVAPAPLTGPKASATESEATPAPKPTTTPPKQKPTPKGAQKAL
jgi:hypothetical protein